MAEPEWLRSFLAIYRAGSVTAAAYHRGISQPAASQHLAALEQAAGARLFIRRPGGVEPTQQGRELYAQVTGPLDALEEVLGNLRGGQGASAGTPVRFGSSPEYFATEVLPRLVDLAIDVSATFGNDTELFTVLNRDELDVAVTSTTPLRRAMRATSIGAKRFTLVAAPTIAPSSPLGSVEELASWLADRPWVSYSLELPITRRFWQAVLGRPFVSRPRLVAPDLRSVLKAVELGLGVSLLPIFICAESLAEGRVIELYPVSELIPEEPWFACTRLGEARRSAVNALLDALATPGTNGVSPPVREA